MREADRGSLSLFLQISDLVLMARLYVLVKRGKLGECRKIVRRQATLRTKIGAD